MIDPNNLDIWRASGAVLGAMLAFVFAWPENRRDFIARLIISLAFGFVMAPILRDRLDLIEHPRFSFAAAMICALFAWWAVAFVVAIFQGKIKVHK